MLIEAYFNIVKIKLKTSALEKNRFWAEQLLILKN